MKDDLKRALDEAFGIVKRACEEAQEMGNEASEAIKGVAAEERLPTGLREALREARKHFTEGAATLGRIQAEHLKGVRDLQLVDGDEEADVA